MAVSVAMATPSLQHSDVVRAAHLLESTAQWHVEQASRRQNRTSMTSSTFEQASHTHKAESNQSRDNQIKSVDIEYYH